ncbi:PREDICTED: trypsin-1-like [Acromyrmex echinatior]|uniref:Coagulation factor XI n=1 Tax=Acromyrmex echinatior TaxID=103372 RepID=F4X0S0_ACREC|nr:PREDICTED: trypsin-1-like [Acromyrmex echinatior]EGI59947.1 Coagulation factor XI [Acromyrmex echinatior]
MLIRFILLLILVIVAITVSVDNELQSNLTIRVEEQNSNSTSGVDNDKGFWEWLLGSVTLYPPTNIELQQPEECLKCTCGLTNKHNRIVGGVETLVNQYPWMVLLLYRGQFYCGGTIINSRHVLTAAHCIDRFDVNKLIARILEHDWNSTDESKTQDFQIERAIRHPSYSTINYDNDIALLKLKDAIKFQDSMRPACLPEKVKTFAGKKGIITGWGAIKEGGQVSHTLQEVFIPILSNAECRATKYPAHRITDNMMCAGFKEGGKDSCQGDSGGPLHIEENGVHQVVGVVSWGEGCAQSGYPGVYARVNRYLTWIRHNTNDGCYC